MRFTLTVQIHPTIVHHETTNGKTKQWNQGCWAEGISDWMCVSILSNLKTLTCPSTSDTTSRSRHFPSQGYPPKKIPSPLHLPHQLHHRHILGQPKWDLRVISPVHTRPILSTQSQILGNKPRSSGSKSYQKVVNLPENPCKIRACSTWIAPRSATIVFRFISTLAKFSIKRHTLIRVRCVG